MKISPLQLETYFITDLHVSANKQFNPEKEIEATDQDLEVDCDCSENPEDKKKWQVILKVKNQPKAEANSPYYFAVEIVGFFEVLDGVHIEKIERLVRTNGPSMLYGTVREVVRDFTARGPFLSVIIPTASFYESTEKSGEPIAEPAENKAEEK